LSNNFADKTIHGLGKEIVIYTDLYIYTGTANVYTKIIKTAEELKALGVGNNRTNTEDILGYYVLGNDITFEHAEDGSDIVTAGYPAGGDYYFKATFDGNGYALKNMRVSDGGIFGLMRGATVKNLKLENVYLTNNPPKGVSKQDGGYSAILAYSAPSSTFENITMTIASAPNAWSWKRDSLLVCSGSWGAATFRNITIDASGLTLNTLLGISHSDKNVYENVVIKAADYVAIGYTADSFNGGVQNTAALMSEFPAGVTFERAYLITDANGVERPLYTGDVTSLGFPAGTEVHELAYPGTTNAWDGTMSNNSNKVLLRKAADEDYASIQFVLGSDFAGSTAFFTWVHYMSNGTKTYKGGGTIYKNGTTALHTEAINAGLDLSYLVFETKTGALVTASNPMKAGVVYTLYAYCTNLVDVELSIYDQSGTPIMLYFANIDSGNGKMLQGTNNSGALSLYMGDVTKLGFEDGTLVQYKTEEYDLVGGSGNWWQSGTAVEINGQILDCSTNVKRQAAQPMFYANEDYDVVCIQFALSEAVASGSVFHVWSYDENSTYLGGGVVSVGQAWANSGFAGAIYDKDGNIATSLEANTVYVLKLRMDGAYRYNFANIVESAMTSYYSATITYENEAE
jgi:hypothetical protein